MFSCTYYLEVSIRKTQEVQVWHNNYATSTDWNPKQRGCEGFELHHDWYTGVLDFALIRLRDKIQPKNAFDRPSR